MTIQNTAVPARPELSAAKRALLDARLLGLHRTAPIPRRGAEGDVPLTYSQERLWFLHRLGQGGTAYNVYGGMRLRGELDPVALERALGEVVRRHEALRTTFREVDGVPVQVIAPFTGFVLPGEDLSDVDPSAREAELRRRVAEVSSTPFDLETGPLFVARLVRLGMDDHALLTCVHHIVSDGWSQRVILNETWALYDAYAAALPSPLPEPAVQYGDWAVWQRARAQREAEARHLAYWNDRLAGAPELLELPTDHARPPLPSFRGGRVPVNAPAEVLERLRDLARAQGATLYMVALAAFNVLLSRYSGAEDVMVGSPIAGRARREVEEVVGLFMNTLVLRTDVSGDPTFRELVDRVRETVLGGYEHQEVPFEQVVAALRPDRSLSHSTLFQVLFQLDNAEEGGAEVHRALRISELPRESDTAKLDLALMLHAGGRGITGALQYSADLFERGTASRMAEHLERLLDQASASPDVRISRLNLVSRTERERITGWNRTTARYPAELCIHQLFEEQARRTPDAVALACGSERLTCAELDARANQLARHLRGMGVGPEVRVGVCLERSPELLVSILGVMKAGGAYVPMDPGHPAERITYLLDDSGVRVLLTQEKLCPRFPSRDHVAVVAVDAARERIGAESAEPVESGVTSENLCYVIYTSGSTGRPKGVAMHHRGVSNYIHWGVRFYAADQGNGAPVFSSMAVDLTVTNLLPLFAGRTVHLLREESPVEALAETIRDRPGFGLIKITPIHLGLLNTMLAPEEMAAAAHTLVIGADVLAGEPTLPWQEHAPHVRLMNEYGPTETVVGCSAYVLPTGRHRTGAVPVGRPIQNLTFYVLDAQMEPVPVGLPGELFIGGVGVARGYLDRPALSAEKFLPDPFAGAGARMYRTGDRARWLADGNLMILGRTDNQVKVRGYRVELGEIEAVLRRHPAVRECIVDVREDRPGDRRLVAYVVSDGVEPASLRDHLRDTLPEYMVPSAFMVMAALPQTSTGKLNRKALPAPEYGLATSDVEEPVSFTEAQLLQVWEELLGVEGIGPTQNFFELGGNSLLALRLLAMVNRRMQCELPVATLFAGATVRAMAAAIEEQAAAGASASPVVPMQPNGSLPPLFCVHPADRGVMGYVNLVRHLGPDQPVYGLRDLGDDLARPVARIAAEHLAAVREVQPRGPYHLAGWSFGGYVAYEMAMQLQRAGEQVAFLGMLDTMSTELVHSWPWVRDLDFIVGAANDVASLNRRPFTLPRESLEGLETDEQVRRALDALHAQGAASAEFGEAHLRELFHTLRDRVRSRRGYVVEPFHGTLTLFRASEIKERMAAFFAPYGDEEKRTMGWCRHVRDIEVRPVPGAHITLASEPHVRVLAEQMTAALA
ncbi:MAG TPA: amino acid adenylation domain-containing protein, partial [Longimicrobium sp.]|nr:amino acid adenylation domain-containing protein [Longimicrobium sp.]